MDSISIELSSEFSQGKKHKELSTEEKAKPYLYAIDKDGNPYTPAWWTSHFFIFYKGPANFQTSIGVENIFDFSYRPAGSGIHSNGRNFKTAIQWGF